MYDAGLLSANLTPNYNFVDNEIWLGHLRKQAISQDMSERETRGCLITWPSRLVTVAGVVYFPKLAAILEYRLI